jgi:transcriptional regulator with XRE-family HTH domain
MSDVKFDEFMKNLGEVLKEKRKLKNIAQGELAEKLGKPQSTIARLESFVVKDTHMSLVFEICEVLDLDLASVLSEAVGKTIASKKIDKKNVDESWRIFKEKAELLDKEKKATLLQIVERLFILTD